MNNCGRRSSNARLYFGRAEGWRSTAIRLLTAAEVSHVAISDGEVVLDPSYWGTRYWAETFYAVQHPGLVEACYAPACVRLDQVPPMPGIRALPTAARYFTAGLWPAANCLTVVVDALAAGGLIVPRWVNSPGSLLRWCRSKGYERVRL